MSEFIFLPPQGSATQKSVTTEPVNASVQNLTQDAASEPFVFLAPPKEGITSKVEDKTSHDLVSAGSGLVGAYTTKKTMPTASNIDVGLINPSASVDRASLQRYLNSQISPSLRLPLAELENVLGGQKIRTMSEVQNALKAIQEVKAERIGKTRSIEEATGQPRKTYTMEPGRPAVDLSKYERGSSLLNKASDQIADLGEIAKSKLGSVGKVGLGGMGGALAGAQLYDAIDQYQKEGSGLHMPSGRNAAQFASGVGGALSTLPFGVTQAAGLALQTPELAYQGYDALNELNQRRKAATKEDTNKMLTNVDIMGNPIP
jgi:hypothetical protein